MVEFDKELLFELGKFTRELRREVLEEVKEGIGIVYIIDFIERKIFQKGYLPAFPAMVSINEGAAHYTVFDEDRILEKGDVVKIDFGVSYKGLITDNAFTVEVETDNHRDLINAAKNSLDSALETFDRGVLMNDIGKSVGDVVEKSGFLPIKNLTGHQMGKNILHYGLATPNYANGDKSEVPSEALFAIEPFITYKSIYVKAIRPSNILHLVKNKPVRDPIAMKVLRVIRENFPYLPFSKRWLLDEVLNENLKGCLLYKGFDKRKVMYGVRVLKREGILKEYDELGVEEGDFVAQFEDTVYVCDDEKVVLTRLGDDI